MSARQVTKGKLARYLEVEDPNVPLEALSGRFDAYQDDGELPPVREVTPLSLRANYKCPNCGGRLTRSEPDGPFVCERCGTVIVEVGGSA